MECPQLRSLQVCCDNCISPDREWVVGASIGPKFSDAQIHSSDSFTVDVWTYNKCVREPRRIRMWEHMVVAGVPACEALVQQELDQLPIITTDITGHKMSHNIPDRSCAQCRLETWYLMRIDSRRLTWLKLGPYAFIPASYIVSDLRSLQTLFAVIPDSLAPGQILSRFESIFE